MSKEDNSISFGMGLLAGVIGGVVASIMLAPKSGEDTREEVKQVVADLAQKCAPEVREARKQALESVDMIKFKLEKQYNKINTSLKAKQMAKAKKMENDGYDLN